MRLLLLGICATLVLASGPAVAEAQMSIDKSFNVDVRFLDAYFGTPGEKIEVGPGDKNTPFTVMLANVGTEDITAIQGQLSTSGALRPADGSGPLIKASADSRARTGEVFSLTFLVNLNDSLEIKQYGGTVDVKYSRVFESGTRQSSFWFDFRVTGASVINANALEPFLVSLQNNDIIIEISNDGTATISGVNVQLAEGSSPAMSSTNRERVVVRNTHWDVGNIGPGETRQLSGIIYVSGSVLGETLRLPLEITYLNAYGDQNSVHRVVDFYVQGARDSIINVSTLEPFLVSLQNNDIIIEISNDGTAPISGVDVQTDEGLPQSMPSANRERVVVRNTHWDVGDVGPGETRQLSGIIYVPGSVLGETLRLPLEITYLNAYGDRNSVHRVVDFYVRGALDVQVYDVRILDLSGSPTIIGEIINEGNENALFGFVTVKPLNGSNVIEYTQFIDEIEIDSPVPFNVPVRFDGEPRYGEHEIEVLIRYKDSVREERFVTHQTVVVIPEPPVVEEDDQNSSLILAVLVVVGIGLTVYAVKRRRSSD